MSSPFTCLPIFGGFLDKRTKEHLELYCTEFKQYLDTSFFGVPPNFFSSVIVRYFVFGLQRHENFSYQQNKIELLTSENVLSYFKTLPLSLSLSCLIASEIAFALSSHRILALMQSVPQSALRSVYALPNSNFPDIIFENASFKGYFCKDCYSMFPVQSFSYFPVSCCRHNNSVLWCVFYFQRSLDSMV